SWGTSGAFDPKDPINKASKTVHNHGITVVFAAGNDGPDQNTLNPYSVAPWVIGVAAGCKLVTPDPTNSAIHCDDPTGQNRAPILADFSSRGVPGDKLYHPDITAPGVHIVSTRASTGTVLNALDANHDLNLTSTCAIDLANQPYYTCASGTSMATPHVAGVVALLQEAAGGTLSPDQVASAITQTARPLPTFALWEVGAGIGALEHQGPARPQRPLRDRAAVGVAGALDSHVEPARRHAVRPTGGDPAPREQRELRVVPSHDQQLAFREREGLRDQLTKLAVAHHQDAGVAVDRELFLDLERRREGLGEHRGVGRHLVRHHVQVLGWEREILGERAVPVHDAQHGTTLAMAAPARDTRAARAAHGVDLTDDAAADERRRP